MREGGKLSTMNDPHEDIYKALADGHRRRIVSALCHSPMVAGELGKLVGLAPNAVSFHLKLLQSAGLVSAKREGRFLRYCVRSDTLDAWRQDVQHQFSTDGAADRQPRPRPTSPVVQPFDRNRFNPPVNAEPEAMPAAEREEDRLPTELL
jgi:DNA-binding transcriptional ArsR family regulator